MGPKGAKVFVVGILHGKLRLDRSLAIQIGAARTTVGSAKCAKVYQGSGAIPKKGMLRSVGHQIRLPSNPTEAVHVIRCGVVSFSQRPKIGDRLLRLLTSRRLGWSSRRYQRRHQAQG